MMTKEDRNAMVKGLYKSMPKKHDSSKLLNENNIIENEI